MFTIASLWVPFTIVAALGQVARNAMQRSLTGPLGTWGATNIRFLFGFPFSVLFLAVVLIFTGDSASDTARKALRQEAHELKLIFSSIVKKLE